MKENSQREADLKSNCKVYFFFFSFKIIFYLTIVGVRGEDCQSPLCEDALSHEGTDRRTDSMADKAHLLPCVLNEES